jgi:uncharacterized protein (TIGR00661 family)
MSNLHNFKRKDSKEVFQYNRFWHFWSQLNNQHYFSITLASLVISILLTTAALFFPVLWGLVIAFPLLVGGVIALCTQCSNFFFHRQNQRLEQLKAETIDEVLTEEIDLYLNHRRICPQEVLARVHLNPPYDQPDQKIKSLIEPKNKADPQNNISTTPGVQNTVEKPIPNVNTAASQAKAQKEDQPKFITRFNFMLPAGVTVQFISDSVALISDKDFTVLSTYNPGIKRYEGEIADPVIKITHTESDTFSFAQRKTQVDIHDSWKGTLPDDFAHLLYACARLAWLERGVFPVHAACIGDDTLGYTLIVGHSGSGKTTVSLQGVFHNHLLLYSGDKTLIKIEPNGEVRAIAGTKMVSIRNSDRPLWEGSIESPVSYADRILFSLHDQQYASTSAVTIKSVVMLKLSDFDCSFSEINFPMSLHLLYPYFMDKAREDITIANGKGVFDGSPSQDTKERLTKSLSLAIQSISISQMRADRTRVALEIARQIRPMQISRSITLESKKILYGVCGIGNGHIFRQIPVINHLLGRGHQIIMFAYGTSYDYFTQKYPPIQVVRTENPYYVADKNGLNFKMASEHPANRAPIFQTNCDAMAYVNEHFGTPNLVITDYECVSAQYGYSVNAPVLTIDQQSKYLLGGFTEVNDTSCQDEVERLSMFFPKATRFAVSFFAVKGDQNTKKSRDHNVRLFPPILRDSITQCLGGKKTQSISIFVYMTAWKDTEQSLEELYSVLNTKGDVDFHIFLPKRVTLLPENIQNLRFYHHGDPGFNSIFACCHGVISTAGHSLLSEAMHLGKPVYATPLKAYEQQMNAKAISDNHFGIRGSTITPEGLDEFLEHLEVYARNIREDKDQLLKGPGNKELTDAVDDMLSSPACSYQ